MLASHRSIACARAARTPAEAPTRATRTVTSAIRLLPRNAAFTTQMMTEGLAVFRLRASVLSPEPSHGLRRPLAAMRPERSPRVRTALGLCGSPSGCSHESHGKLGTTTCDIGDETRRTAEPRGPLRARVQTSSQAAPATLATSRSHEAVCRSGRAPGRDRSRRAHPASRIEPVDEIQQRDDLPCSRTIGFGQMRPSRAGLRPTPDRAPKAPSPADHRHRGGARGWCRADPE